jgi:hypothetical protein
MGKFFGVATGGVVGGVIMIAAGFWFSPSGTGEFQKSPDGKFTANASNMSAGTWFHGRDRYIKLSVVESATEREVWQIQYRDKLGAKVPDYSIRGKHFINWAKDSSSVTIPTSDDRKVTLNLPMP